MRVSATVKLNVVLQHLSRSSSRVSSCTSMWRPAIRTSSPWLTVTLRQAARLVRVHGVLRTRAELAAEQLRREAVGSYPEGCIDRPRQAHGRSERADRRGKPTFEAHRYCRCSLCGHYAGQVHQVLRVGGPVDPTGPGCARGRDTVDDQRCVNLVVVICFLAHADLMQHVSTASCSPSSGRVPRFSSRSQRSSCTSHRATS